MFDTPTDIPTALVVVDVQVEMTQPKHPDQPLPWNLDWTLANIQLLLDSARSAGARVIYVQHDSRVNQFMMRGQPGFEIEPRIAPRNGETVVVKNVCDSFSRSTLEQELRAAGITHFVTCGIQSDFCVDMATKSGLSRGFNVTLASDAHTTWDNGILTAEQIIAHHNVTAINMSGPNACVLAKPAAEIRFARVG